MTGIPVHVCLLTHVHAEHDWVYTSSGGGHMMDTWDDTGVERNQKWWHCPGIAGVDEDLRAENARLNALLAVRLPDEVTALAKLIREAKRLAWDEGFGAGVVDQTRWQLGGKPEVETLNPYGEHDDRTTAE